jgi:hypothetical protein
VNAGYVEQTDQSDIAREKGLHSKRAHGLGREEGVRAPSSAGSAVIGIECFACAKSLTHSGPDSHMYTVSRALFPNTRLPINLLSNCAPALLQQYYPEHLGQMFIVNAPMVFKAIWAVVRPWLEARTQTKIQVVSNEKQARESLLAVIPAENLIQRLGGLSKVDMMSEIGEGPWADESILERVRMPFKDSSATCTGSFISADTAVESLAS